MKTTNHEAERIVISKSAKRKMTSTIRVPDPEIEGKTIERKRYKLGTFTEQVVYKTKIGKKKNGKPLYYSVTKHEIAKGRE